MQEGGAVDVFAWLSQAGALLPTWWSRARDRSLRQFWKNCDALASAMYAMQTKVSSIAFHIEPRDASVQAHMRQADEYQRNLEDMTDFGRGWIMGIPRALEDLFGQDNGAFFEVIGEGRKDGPVVGPALGIAPLDAAGCVRTNSPEYPVVYYDPQSGGRFKLHYSRVAYASQMPSADVRMNGVGYCALSRCAQAAQNLTDMAQFKMEALGSRPKRQILLAKKGLSADDVTLAFRMADQQMDQEGLARYSRSVVIAPKRAGANVEVDLEAIPLAAPGEWFNEEQAVTLGIYMLAFAFGVDAREFWPATSSGATKADAMVQHMKARGKAIGNTLAALETLLNRWYLPRHLRVVFDVQDDDEDQQRAAIQETRSTTAERDLKGKVYDVRKARQDMVEEGHMTSEQYDEAELADGRLPGGEDVLSLFYSDDPLLSKLLDLGEAQYNIEDEEAIAPKESFDPLNKEATTWGALALVVDERRRDCLKLMAQQLNASTAGPKRAARQAMAALDALEKYWGKGKDSAAPKPSEEAAGAQGENPAGQMDEAAQGGETVEPPTQEVEVAEQPEVA